MNQYNKLFFFPIQWNVCLICIIVILELFQARSELVNVKVHIFWEGHKILRNIPVTFDYSTYSQKLGEDFENFVAFSEYMNFERVARQ